MIEAERPASGPVYFESVQYLRGIAAFLVLLAHLPDGLPFAWNRAFRGGIGVDLFFIISGFVMAFTIERQGQGVRAAVDFAVRRALRIFPLYAVATLTMVLVNFYLGEPWPDWGYVLASISTFPLTTPPGEYAFPYLFLGWSLSFEIFFYVILVGLLCVRKASWIYVMSVLTGLVLVGALLKPQEVWTSFVTAPILLEFAFGFIAFHLWQKRCDQLRSHRAFQIAACMVFLVALKGFDGDSVGAFPKMMITYFGGAASWRSLGWGIPAFLFFVAMLCFEGKFHSRSKASLKTLGDVSYSLYLFHESVFHLLVPIIGVKYFPLTLVYIAAAIWAAWFAYQYLELPLMRMGRRLHLR